MGFINLDMSLGNERTHLPEGRYDLRVLDVDNSPARSGADMYTITIGAEGHPEARAMRFYLVMPKEDDSPEAREFKMLNIKRFLYTFNIPMAENGFDDDDLLGATASNVAVGIQDRKEGQDEDYNEIRLNKLPKEA